MLERLLTEQSQAAQDASRDSALPAFLAAMNAADTRIAAAITPELPRIARAVTAIVAALSHGGSLIYIGAGTSGRLGVLDAAECPPTFHTPPRLIRALIAGGDLALRQSVEGAEDDASAGVRDLVHAGLTDRDAVAGISASGRTPYVVAAVAHARQAGSATISISCTPDSPLSRAAEFPIEALAGPEIIAGSTRLRAGSATKLVLNMLSTAALVQLGYTYRGLMVNVQPTNEKLQDRARRIIQDLAGVSFERASELLEASARRVPVAVVMSRKNASREQAEQLLEAARGRLSLILDES